MPPWFRATFVFIFKQNKTIGKIKKRLPEIMQSLHLHWYLTYKGIHTGFVFYNIPGQSPENKKRMEYIILLLELV